MWVIRAAAASSSSLHAHERRRVTEPVPGQHAEPDHQHAQDQPASPTATRLLHPTLTLEDPLLTMTARRTVGLPGQPESFLHPGLVVRGKIASGDSHAGRLLTGRSCV